MSDSLRALADERISQQAQDRTLLPSTDLARVPVWVGHDEAGCSLSLAEGGALGVPGGVGRISLPPPGGVFSPPGVRGSGEGAGAAPPPTTK